MRITSRSLVCLTFVTLAALAATTPLSAQRGYARGRADGPAPFVMSGTYELEATRGDDPRRAADRATRDLPRGARDRAYDRLVARLEPPRVISLDRDRDGRTFAIASSNGPRTTFDIDRREWRERGGRDREVTTHVEYVSDRLSIWTSGDRDSDYWVSFQLVDRGSRLFVTRRFDNEALRQPVTIRSYYRRVAAQPRWDVYVAVRDDRRDDRRPGWSGGADNGRLVAVLDTPLSTRTARDGQRFSMTVRDRGEYQGARIDGVVERVTADGRDHNAEMRLVFDRIHTRSGRDTEVDAVLEAIRTPNGTVVRVDGDGQVAERSRTADTVEKGTVGAAIGAIVGGIIGGGKGAAIGAAVGGAGGVVVAQTRGQALDLPAGSELTLRLYASR